MFRAVPCRLHPSGTRVSGIRNGRAGYIDPSTCIECDACLAVCPVDAIYPDAELPESMRPYLKINAAYFASR